jgi:arylsulfatase A-like enzyme
MKDKIKWLIVIASILVTLASWLSYSAITSTSLFKPKTKPNIILIITDDLDFSLMPYLKNTGRLLTKEGATFTNYFVTSPLCCPSRASILLGQYPHNTNVLDNTGFRDFFGSGKETETIATWLNRAGYKTALAGKYLNGYPLGAGRNYIPPGWTDWHAFIHGGSGATYYYDYKMGENGRVIQYSDLPSEYSTDVIKMQSINFIEQSLAENNPFFILISVIAPHPPSYPAVRHSDTFQNLTYPRKPSFHEKDLSDKPSSTHSAVAIADDLEIHDTDAIFTQRVQAMQAVDEMVGEVILLLQRNSQLDNTYIFFTSDNGYHLGEHNLPPGKGYPYEEDIHVPFIVRGPGIKPDSQITQMVANIDIAPTIIEMTHALPVDMIDGRSLMPLFKFRLWKDIKWRDALLLEAGYMNQGAFPLVYRGVRTDTFVYVEYKNGELEYYDLFSDPYELDNIANDLDSTVLASLHSWLEQLKTCRAEECRIVEMSMPDNIKNSP